jgi:hypothetical protein
MNNNKKILLEKYIKKAIKQKLQEEEAAIKRAEKSLYLVYRFPKLKDAMEGILSPSFSRYLSSVTVVAPKPTTFNVELINGLDFQLIYSSGGKTEGNFIAKVAGKRYDLAMGSATDRASQAISNLLSLSPALKEDANAAAPADAAAAPEPPSTPDAGEAAFNDLAGAETPATPETPPTEETPPAEA